MTPKRVAIAAAVFVVGLVVFIQVNQSPAPAQNKSNGLAENAPKTRCQAIRRGWSDAREAAQAIDAAQGTLDRAQFDQLAPALYLPGARYIRVSHDLETVAPNLSKAARDVGETLIRASRGRDFLFSQSALKAGEYEATGLAELLRPLRDGCQGRR
ncbi:MAG: hypothetical protein M3Q23_00645 [Actinomycetota bacterium]|nr:hypothetical protein [Actinomycetota bacterium]